MQVGEWNVLSVLEGTFMLDGGSMFGIVPKPLWSHRHPADERNRITMALRTLLVQRKDRRILIDCGIGDRFSSKQNEIYCYDSPLGGITGALAKLGVRPEDITDVIASHLHFDHVGGLLTRDDSKQLRPTFPKATLHVQEDCWKWAHNPSSWDQASFFKDDFDIISNSMRVNLLQGDREVAEQVRVRLTGGHTPGHQIVVIGTGNQSVVFCADLIPTVSHIRLPYIMSYDHQPLLTLEEKKMLLALALEENWILAFEHDPWLAACRLEEHNQRLVPGDQVCLNI
jgi:glyoxylase-like metal-dependent hydrolase (beta-lactamase superfamily II)